jgi:hypothetical protein
MLIGFFCMGQGESQMSVMPTQPRSLCVCRGAWCCALKGWCVLGGTRVEEFFVNATTNTCPHTCSVVNKTIICSSEVN